MGKHVFRRSLVMTPWDIRARLDQTTDVGGNCMPEYRMTWEEAVQWLRDQPDQQDLVRHCYYDDPLELAAERFWRSEEWTAIRQLLVEFIPGKVLDLGAGRGISSYAFAREGCMVTALEPDPSPLVGAGAIRTLFSNSPLPVQVIQEHGERLPVEANTFEIVYGRAVLHHASNLTQFCREAARVLRSGGMFIATREHVISKTTDRQQFLDSHALHFLYGGENAYLLREYTDAIKASGLNLQMVLGPLESPVNYSPMTTEAVKEMVIARLERYVGRKLGEGVGSREWGQRFGRWFLSRMSHAPGRLYSFLATKV
jgi:SAM-dependent methyltransferase